MTRPRHHVANAIGSLAVLFLFSCAAADAPAPPQHPVMLVETRPVESSLGNPDVAPALETWLDWIRSAKSELDIEQFYISTWPGEPMQPVLAAIGEAAARGVKVRVIVDSNMHRTYPQPVDSLGTVPGIEVRVIPMGRIAGGVQHAKFFLVDRSAIFLGSQNFDWRALKHIHELGVGIRDVRVAGIFQEVFDMDWKASGPDTLPPAAIVAQTSARHAPLPIRIVQQPGDTVDVWPSYNPRGFIPDSTLWDRDAIVRMLDAARKEIVVQVLKYSPESRREKDYALDDALRRAAARGVPVRMIVSDWETDSPEISHLQDLARVPNVIVKLSTVPEWSGGYIPFGRVEHLKYVVVDSLWTWVGTSNWEPGYFTGSRNLAVTMRNRPIAGQARRIFEASWIAPGAAPLNPDSTYTPKIHGETPPVGKKKYGG
jgi:phosphatidylserine/phosphatidylglycerophosphate/cardiolipin synthase-like enzyme